MLSAWLGHIKTVCFLLEAGADRDIEDNGDGLDLIDPWASLPLRNIEDKWTALRCAQSQRHNAIAVILGKETLNKQNEIKKALLTATESGCPTILANLLQRGANLDVAKNEHGETAFQITAKFPQIKMEAYKEHIKEIKRKKAKKPKESMHTFMKEAEGISREMAKIILTHKVDVHDQASISNRISDITNFCDQKHFDEQIFGAEQKFYLNKTKYFVLRLYD